jgi:hypothetical protein
MKGFTSRNLYFSETVEQSMALDRLRSFHTRSRVATCTLWVPTLIVSMLNARRAGWSAPEKRRHVVSEA